MEIGKGEMMGYFYELIKLNLGKLKEDKLKKLEKLLDELPKRELDFNKLKEVYYEAKMLD